MTALGSQGGGGSSPRRVSPAAVLLACAALGAGGLAAGCGGGDGDPSSTASGASQASTEAAASTAADGTAADGSAESTDEIEIADFKYDPETVTVEAGAKLTWDNSDDAAHTATADDGSFDTGTLDRGDHASTTFDEPGTFTYYCRFHAFMKATVEVR